MEELTAFALDLFKGYVYNKCPSGEKGKFFTAQYSKDKVSLQSKGQARLGSLQLVLL